MSAIYDRRRLGIAWIALAALLALGACSSSGPRVDTPDQAAVTSDARAETEREAPPRHPVPEPNLDPIPERLARDYDNALLAMQAGQWAEAELALEQLILEEPGFPGPYVNLSIIYARSNRIDEAMAMLEQALGIHPGFPAANNELGRLLRRQGRFDEAAAAYARALETDPGYALAHYNLGILLDVYLRRPAEALSHYASYQDSLSEPDETVARWIIDLERRSGLSVGRVARDQ